MTRTFSGQSELKSFYRSRSVAAQYVGQRFTGELNRLLHERQVVAIDAAAKAIQPTWILEIAPGPGRLTREISLPGRLVCLEYNEGMIQFGQEACDGKAVWVRGDGFQLPFNQTFDLVYSFRFLRHFHRDERERLYEEIRRVLKPGGYFVVDAVNERVSGPLRKAHPEEYPIYDKLYWVRELREELTKAGLEPLNLQPVQKFYRSQYLSQVILGPRANWVNRLVIRALESFPRRHGLEWIVTCRRG